MQVSISAGLQREIPADTASPAGPGVRALALLLDVGMQLALLAIAVFALWMLKFNPGRFSALVPALVGLGYQVGFLTRSGATPGKHLLGLRVVTHHGEPLTAARVIGRTFASGLSSMFFGLGYLPAVFRPDRRTFHDLVADTRVIRVVTDRGDRAIP